RIRDRATLWEKRFEDEASWNMEVHHHILRAVCRPKGRRAAVDFISCTTARISPTFIPSGERGKMVDSCLFIDPAAYGATAEERIQDLCSRQPHGSINHTDHMPLFGQPIAVSVETKRSAVDWDNATLQTGTWQAAQLRCLSQLATLAATSYGRESLGSPTAGVAVIDFVPGIIIQGHDWHLVASVHTGGVTTFRTKIPIGTTETVLGVYKILAALTYLVRWSENVYWPCFKTSYPPLTCLTRLTLPTEVNPRPDIRINGQQDPTCAHALPTCFTVCIHTADNPDGVPADYLPYDAVGDTIGYYSDLKANPLEQRREGAWTDARDCSSHNDAHTSVKIGTTELRAWEPHKLMLSKATKPKPRWPTNEQKGARSEMRSVHLQSVANRSAWMSTSCHDLKLNYGPAASGPKTPQWL
ncbi:hypothetical protein JX266_014345, partial [Neoarthrinium moseri]